MTRRNSLTALFLVAALGSAIAGSDRSPLVIIGGAVKQLPTGDTVPFTVLHACSADQILKWNGSAWACAADADSGGDITGVTAGTGLTGGGTSGAVTLDVGCSTGLTCAADTVTLNFPTTACSAGQAITAHSSVGAPTCSAFVTSGTLTANTIAMGTAAGAIGNSPITYDGSALITIPKSVSIATGTGQAALFSTPRAASTDGLNLCAGGGCASVAYNGVLSATGSSNTAFGLSALNADTTGYQNVAVGVSALAANTVGIVNVAVGANALAANTTGAYNVAIGHNTMSGNTTSVDNVAIGDLALMNNTIGTGNVAIGVQALETSTETYYNVAVGLNALVALTSGYANVAVGYEAGKATTTALANTALGYETMNSCTTGGDNTALGGASLQNLTTGTYNTAVGVFAGNGITTGDYNTIVGRATGLAAGTTTKIILADGTDTAIDQIWFSPAAPTSVNHGTLGTGSTNTVGNVTGIGANTSVVLTFSNSGFPNRAWCHAQTNTSAGALEQIVVTNSKTAPTFSCLGTVLGTAANCEDFTYWCTGQ